MFKIEYHNNGFKISTGDRRPVHARDVDELHRAIDHYFCKERTTDDKCARSAGGSRQTTRGTHSGLS